MSNLNGRDKYFNQTFHVDPSPHLKDTDEAKDITGKVIKVGNHIECWLQGMKDRKVRGRIEEVDDILWVRVYEKFLSEKDSILIADPEKQDFYPLIHNFINRCYYTKII